MNHNWIELMQGQNQVASIITMNDQTCKYGLALTEEDAKLIVARRKTALAEQRRVEFGAGVVTKIIQEFCDSQYIDQHNYVQVIIRLQEIFYLYKNEMMDEITDDELIHVMREQFDRICFGDLDYLESTGLADFAEAVRAGYRGHHSTDGYGIAEQFDPNVRWDFNLFAQALMDN